MERAGGRGIVNRGWLQAAGVLVVGLLGCERAEPIDPEPKLVLSEVDYDQGSIEGISDSAELIELYNMSDESCDLRSLELVLVNGSGEFREYRRISLAPVRTLPGRGYLLIGNPPPGSVNHGIHYVPQGWAETDNLQNGPNDGVLLVNLRRKQIVDALIYESRRDQLEVAGMSLLLDELTVTSDADARLEPGSLVRDLSADQRSKWRFTGMPSPGAANARIPTPSGERRRLPGSGEAHERAVQ